MAQPSDSNQVFTFLKLMIVVVIVIAVAVILFGAISALAGVVWFFVKLVIVLAIIFGLYKYFSRK